jgi:hydrogenase nickel incorporation protein HypA/HybF
VHEFSLAQDVAQRLTAEAERAGARRIVAVDIEVGGLSHASAEHLSFWIKEALEDGPGRDATVRVLRAAPSILCRDCEQRSSAPPPDDEEWDAYSLPARCPQCGSAHVELEGDTACVIRHLELER